MAKLWTTVFANGPASKSTLALRYAPRFLRVVVSEAGRWDALDRPSDNPRSYETVMVYQRIDLCRMHVNARCGNGGWKDVAMYSFRTEQPPAEIQRSAGRWMEWVTANGGLG